MSGQCYFNIAFSLGSVNRDVIFRYVRPFSSTYVTYAHMSEHLMAREGTLGCVYTFKKYVFPKDITERYQPNC